MAQPTTIKIRFVELKTWPTYFEPVKRGEKKAEIRRNDRNFTLSDFLVLREWNAEKKAYTGRVLVARISHITHLEALDPNLSEWVMLSIEVSGYFLSMEPMSKLELILTNGDGEEEDDNEDIGELAHIAASKMARA